MADLTFTQGELEREKIRRAKQKCDEYQTEFSPYKEFGFWNFLQYYAPEFYTDEKIPLRDLSEILRKVTIGELKKVLISFFPRAGKSRTTSMWIAWWLGYDPAGSFMRNCYNDTLAMDMSKAVLDILKSQSYKDVFPEVKLDPHASAKMSWQLDDTGIATYFGAGMNGTITGKGCNRAAIFDDPIKNPEEAMSEAYLEKIDTFIEYALTTRVEIGSDCAEIIIQTRWCDLDPIGRRENDEEWHKFIFPVLNEDGTSICEAMFPAEKAIKIRDRWIANGKKWMYDALYQGIPSDAEFSKLNIKSMKRFSMNDIRGKEPDEVIGWCDYANKGTDNLSAPFCYRYGNRKYIVGVVFSDKDSKELEEPLLEKIIRFKPDELTFESNQGGREFADKFTEKYKYALEALGLEPIVKYATVNKEIRIMLKIGEIKNDCYFLEDNEQDNDYKRFFINLTAYGKYKYGKDDAIDSIAGLLSATSDLYDVEVDYFGEEKDKILDIKQSETVDETETDEDDSEFMCF